MAEEVKQEEIIRRNRPGTKTADLDSWPPQELEEMDSTFAVQQYIEQLERKDNSDVVGILQLPNRQDESVWLTDHLRIFVSRLTQLAIALDQVCTAETCKEMSASGQQYRCAAHKEPKDCCAIDYILHTIDQTAALLNHNTFFPSRVNVAKKSMKFLHSAVRRVYRVFAHAYFHHEEEFRKFEAATHLCERFIKFATQYKLMPPAQLIIPNDFMNKS